MRSGESWPSLKLGQNDMSDMGVQDGLGDHNGGHGGRNGQQEEGKHVTRVLLDKKVEVYSRGTDVVARRRPE